MRTPTTSSARRSQQFHLPGKHDQKSHGGKAGAPGVPQVEGNAGRVFNTGYDRVVERQKARDTTVDESLALASRRHYTEAGYRPMNQVLRGQDADMDSDMRETSLQYTGHLDRSFEMHGVQNAEQITVYRGVVRDKFLSGLSPGDRITDDGFLSTTANPRVADDFGSNRMVINVPPGRTSLSGVLRENELIYPRGTELQFNGRGENGEYLLEMV